MLGISRTGWWLSMLFLAALFTGAGPGILWVNQPKTWLGLPQLYAWGIFWCGVEALIVLAAYLTVWRDE